MPSNPSTFRPHPLVRSPHIQTILPSLFRKPPVPNAAPRTLDTEDGDILRYHHLTGGNSRLVIISHGLEGSFESSYVLGMMNALHLVEWDVLAWNMRGCGDEPNRLVTWYHSGQSKDLKTVVSFAQTLGYSEIALVGFSIGGNITLKYLGEEARALQGTISRAVVISVPMDLAGSAAQLARRSNAIYMQYLLRPLRRRMRQKARLFPNTFDIRDLSSITTFHEFDTRFTAPFHGFSSVNEYWERSSSLNYVREIAIPTLAITSIDDPFLSRTCIPDELAKGLPLFTLEASSHGGHVGFIETPRLTSTWSEQRTVTFLNTAR